jgi:hypothetical protein
MTRGGRNDKKEIYDAVSEAGTAIFIHYELLMKGLPY